MVKKPFFTILFISWLVFLTLLSLFSFEDVDMPSIRIPYLDKVVHFTFYFIAAFFGYMAIKERKLNGLVHTKQLLRLFLFLMFYGIIIEVLQSTITTSRSGDVMDFLANSIGAICGIFIMYFFHLEKKDLK